MNDQLAKRMTIDVPAKSREGVLCVRMSGDVDVADGAELSLAGPRIRGPGAHTVFLDVGPVTFFGTTLVNFLVHLVNTAPGGQVVLCRPSPMARRVVGALSLPIQISTRPDLPPEWVEPPAGRRTGRDPVAKFARLVE